MYNHGDRVKLKAEYAKFIIPTTGRIAKRKSDDPENVWVEFDELPALNCQLLVPLKLLERNE